MKKEKVKKSNLGFITILLILIVVFILNFILWEIYPKEIETINYVYIPEIIKEGEVCPKCEKCNYAKCEFEAEYIAIKSTDELNRLKISKGDVYTFEGLFYTPSQYSGAEFCKPMESNPKNSECLSFSIVSNKNYFKPIK